MNLRYINPDSLPQNPAFSQAVEVTGNRKTVYVGGKNSVDSQGVIVGRGDLKERTRQTLLNLLKVLRAAGGGLEHVIKWNTSWLGSRHTRDLRLLWRCGGQKPNPPAITVLFVSGLAQPGFLVEIDAIAELPIG